jgi:two-component system CheB/CheR fusion protein
MSHSLNDLADFLGERRDAMLERLRGRVIADPHMPDVQTLSRQQFLDSIPAMLDRLNTDLRARTDRAAESAPDGNALAEAHGKQRLRAGYTVDQVLWEMDGLHTALMEELTQFFHERPNQRVDVAVSAARLIGSFIVNEAARSAAAFSRAETAALNAANMETILAQMPFGVLFTDVEGRLVRMNPAASAMLGYEAPAGVQVADLAELHDPVSGEVLAWNDTPLGRALKGEVVSSFEATAKRPDGLHVHYLFNAGPLRDADGAISGAVAVCHDITVRKRAETILKEADRSKDRFLALVSHEMRDPVSAISNAVALLSEMSADPSRHLQARDVIERNARKIGRLVEDLMDVSRIIQNKVVLQRAPLCLEQMAARVLDEMEPRVLAKGLTLERDVSAEVWVDGDALRLEQILTNIVGNAVKYTERGGIRVSVRGEESEAVVTVTDTGIGISPESLPTLFDAFIQADSSLAHAGGGLGLGLALVRSYTEMHGGSVSVYSDGPGTGATITVRLPLCPPSAQKLQKRDAAPGGDGRPPAILLVDDHLDARAVLRDILELDGYRVLEAENGATALDLACCERPHIVLLDIGLPDMDGYEVAARLRARPEPAGLRIVAITGYGPDADMGRAKDGGFDAHLTKPVDLHALRALLSDLLNPAA